MIVIDASAIVEFLLGSAKGRRVASRLRRPRQMLHAPHLVDLEVIQALRRATARRELTDARAQEAFDDFRSLRMRRYRHATLLPRIWELRQNLTAYDAAYVALAEALRSPLVTCDAGLGRAPGHRARVEVI